MLVLDPATPGEGLLVRHQLALRLAGGSESRRCCCALCFGSASLDCSNCLRRQASQVFRLLCLLLLRQPSSTFTSMGRQDGG